VSSVGSFFSYVNDTRSHEPGVNRALPLCRVKGISHTISQWCYSLLKYKYECSTSYFLSLSVQDTRNRQMTQGIR